MAVLALLLERRPLTPGAPGRRRLTLSPAYRGEGKNRALRPLCAIGKPEAYPALVRKGVWLGGVQLARRILGGLFCGL